MTNGIACFYLNRKTEQVHIREFSVNKCEPPIDRIATQDDAKQYPKQWDHFRFSDKEFNYRTPSILHAKPLRRRSRL